MLNLILKKQFLICWICLTLFNIALQAQQEVSVRVQVNRMADGHYPTKVYQFSNTPGLVTITLTNLGNTTHNLYLTGKLTGDNGVLVTTSKNYQPPTTIELGPFASKILNAIEASYLFDANNLVYQSGGTSIKASVFGEQGLPEGTYQLCIRAMEAQNRKPLSDEDPIGCSNIFQVALLEPPMILNPYSEQSIFSTGVQSFPLRWTTPPGAPPSTEYLVRIVEVFGQRNPYDAMLSTPTPFFETTVRGAPLFLYSVLQPQMQEGRTYAMIVVASDPLGNATFRNNGQSEVVSFTYGTAAGTGNNPLNPIAGGGPAPEYANHKLTGHLSWAFKKTELTSYTLSTGGNEYAKVKPSATQYASVTGSKPVDPGTQAIQASPYLAANASPAAFALQTTITPLVSMNAIAAVNADQTLLKPAATISNQLFDPNKPIAQLALPTGYLSGSGSSTTDITYETVTVDTASERFPLPGVSVTLQASVAGGARPILLAAGQTDAEGNFTLEFLDPAYASGNGTTGLTLTVGTNDFENTNLGIPLSVLKSENAEVGNHTLLAKTFRLFPKLLFDSTADNDNGYGFHIYREAQELQLRPWLAYEGQSSGKKSSAAPVAGQMIEIASDSIPASTTSGKLHNLSTLDAKGTGRVFFGGSIYVSFVPSSSDYYNRSSVVSVMNVPLPSSRIAVARVEYKLTHKPSSVSGSVFLPMGEQGRIPAQGSLVRVTYRRSEREPGLDPNELIQQTAKVNSGAAIYGSANQSAATPSWANTTVHDPGITSVQAMAWGVSTTGLTAPMILEPKGQGTELTAKAVLNPTQLATDLNTVPDSMRAITSTVDELGNYFISLPPLKQGADIIVEVVSRPADFRKFAIEAQGYQKPQAEFLLDKGASKNVDFTIKADVADVVGRVVDDQGKPLVNARINFKGNTLGASGPDGLFQFTIYPGSHRISYVKEGYVVKEETITVPQLTNNASADQGYASKWLSLTVKEKQTETLSRIGQSETVKASVSRGNSFSAAMFGIAAPSGNSGSGGGVAQATFNGGLATAFGISTESPGSQYEVPRRFAIDLKDVGYLNKIVGKARFRVVDESNNAIANVTIEIFDSTNKTDAKGEWYYEGFGGSATLTLIAPPGTSYVAMQQLVNLAETGKEELIVVTMKKGMLISGIVSGGGKPLPDTRILLDDQDFSGIKTDASGHYSVYTSPGPHKVGARKQGYVGSDKGAPGLSPTNALNFDLQGGNGRNYSTLLGFAIELDESIPGTTQEKWSGNFVQLQPVDKNIFGLTTETRIPFSNLMVTFDAQGNAIPANGVVRTDLTELPIKLFGYLPVKLTGEDVIVFTRSPDGKGVLSGKIDVAFNALQGYRGWTKDDGKKMLLAKVGSASADKIVVFNSAGAQPTDQQFGFVGENGNEMSASLYGFKVSLKAGKADKDGIEFSGSISTPELGPIKSMSIVMTKLLIDKAVSVSGVLIDENNLPSLEIAGWKAALQSLIFNEGGFKVGGDLSLTIPKSKISIVSFSDLGIANNAIFGGNFSIPQTGINILTLANLKTDGIPLTFGRVGSSDVYRLAGKANFLIDVNVFNKAFRVPSFEILTNGDFTVETPTDYTTKFSRFDFSVTNLVIKSKDNTPSILVQGKFKVDLSFIKFEVADITIKPAGGGPVFSVAKVGVRLEVPVLTTTVIVGFSNDGFEGEGGLGITGTPIGGSVGFKYYEHEDGTMELGAKFFANTPPIPIGGPVTLEGIGGGFTYTSGGPNGGFGIDVSGKISWMATGTLVALNPIGLTVVSTGVLKGYGDLVMGNFFKRGHAEVVFNGPESTFTVQVDLEMSPMEGLAQETVRGVLLISAKKDDQFAFLGCSVLVRMIGLIDNHGEMAIAVNLKNPKSHDDLTAHFFEYAPADYMQERFSGVYINVSAKTGIDANNALGFDLYVASAKLWLAYGYNASLLLNFDENAYRLSFGGAFELGIEACVAKVACVNISAGMCIHVEGGRSNTLGWNFQATATGSASLGAGIGVGHCSPGCNEVVSITDGCVGGAFKICGNVSLDLNFNEKNGLNFNARAGGNTTPCF